MKVMVAAQTPDDDPSLLTEVPGWVVGSAIAAIITIVITALMNWKFWRSTWRCVSRQSPVYIHVETDPRRIFANIDYDWVTFSQFVPLAHDELPPPPNGFATEMGAWAIPLGGFPAEHCQYGVTITARDDIHVVVKALKIKAKAVPLPDGSIVTKGVGGASMESRRIQVDLNSVACRTTWVERGGAPGDPFEFQLAPGESADFKLYVDATTDEEVDMYEWWGTLELLVKGRPKTVRIGRSWLQRHRKGRGNSFRLVNRNRRPSYMNIPGSENLWDASPF